ncbi:hypothetical protein BSF41_12890 [Flavobacterium sp. ACN2]|uniref:hypothetical protein n=1 Tax=unclassified Flavobacterium TaxID=196869 RepID=UPI000BB32870|nr:MULTISPECIES: hypothetical protein [unclassified Flavobacterium]MDY0987161.1 hypothetical protein [Flavobacterium sp. CFBP9031]PBI91685.1 hypothetical protein BSF41_12890 [Flavobacterium sp. ACN2]
MKKIIFILSLAFGLNVTAQSSVDEIKLIQDLYGKSKAEVVKEYLGLTDVQAAAFQPIYDKYETERKALSQKKIQILEDYAKNYANLSDAKATELTSSNLKYNQEAEKLLAKTHSKLVKPIGGINAAKFVQLEQYLQVTIRAEIQDAIPFIGELDKTKKH